MDGWGSRRVTVEFESEGAVLRGFLYQATKGKPPFPMVVMAHGTSATVPMVADRYGEVFAEAGVSALLYDHRNPLSARTSVGSVSRRRGYTEGPGPVRGHRRRIKFLTGPRLLLRRDGYTGWGMGSSRASRWEYRPLTPTVSTASNGDRFTSNAYSERKEVADSRSARAAAAVA